MLGVRGSCTSPKGPDTNASIAEIFPLSFISLIWMPHMHPSLACGRPERKNLQTKTKTITGVIWRRELQFFFISSTPWSEHNHCFVGGVGGSTIRRVHLFVFSGLENWVDTLSLDLIFIYGKFVFSFYCHSVINWCINFAKFKTMELLYALTNIFG